MKEKTCCFKGATQMPAEQMPLIRTNLERQIIKLIHQGVTCFCIGGDRGFDFMAELAVLKMKETYTNVRLILVLPHRDQTKGWPLTDVMKHRYIVHMADRVLWAADTVSPDCVKENDRQMADMSAHLICYQPNPTDTEENTIGYAKRQGMSIINLADFTPLDPYLASDRAAQR